MQQYHQTRHGVNCNISLKLRHHLTYFGPDTAQHGIGVSTHLPGSH